MDRYKNTLKSFIENNEPEQNSLLDVLSDCWKFSYFHQKTIIDIFIKEGMIDAAFLGNWLVKKLGSVKDLGLLRNYFLIVDRICITMKRILGDGPTNEFLLNFLVKVLQAYDKVLDEEHQEWMEGRIVSFTRSYSGELKSMDGPLMDSVKTDNPYLLEKVTKFLG